jgi:predicted alpha/beta-fold hydrolase
VKDIKNIFNPYAAQDLHVMLTYLDTLLEGHDDTPIAIVGFSLGALILGKYMSSRGDQVSKKVCAAVCVSGAWSLDFAEGWRYKNTF